MTRLFVVSSLMRSVTPVRDRISFTPFAARRPPAGAPSRSTARRSRTAFALPALEGHEHLVTHLRHEPGAAIPPGHHRRHSCPEIAAAIGRSAQTRERAHVPDPPDRDCRSPKLNRLPATSPCDASLFLRVIRPLADLLLPRQSYAGDRLPRKPVEPVRP